jgi:hypothetical protein
MARFHHNPSCALLLTIVTCLALTLFAGCAIPGASAGGKTAVGTVTPTATLPPACPSNAYCTKVPGPKCDSGSAQWLTLPPATVTCGTSGVQLNLAGGKGGGVAFVPPGNTFPTSFSVAVTVQVDSGFDGCVGLSTIGHNGFYVYYVCSVGVWFINLNLKGATPKELAKGVLTTSTVYRIVVTTNGNDRSLMINGASAGSVSDGTLPATIGVGLTLLNLGSAPDMLTLSDFVYTTLG